MRLQNMRLLDADFDDDTVGPNCTCNDDPFRKPDYRAKKHTRPVGRVVRKRKFSRLKFGRIMAEVAG
jgi:hypothetical protein